MPGTGWRSFLLRLLLANAVMAIAILLMSVPMTQWLAETLHQRIWRLMELFAVAGVVYFLALAACGMRLQDFRRH